MELSCLQPTGVGLSKMKCYSLFTQIFRQHQHKFLKGYNVHVKDHVTATGALVGRIIYLALKLSKIAMMTAASTQQQLQLMMTMI